VRGAGLASAWRATALYAVLAIATTWPLAPHLTRSLIDQGDSLLNCWILSWNADHLLAWFWGNASAFQDYWHPPIFHPAPLALAYSEHLFGESLLIAPIYGLTRNSVLCYNLLLLSSYVLSALGTYLLVRELTKDALAAWVAGACYGFALLRLPQLTHLQVLSSQWMPFVLYGLRRYFTTLRADPLAGAAVALVLQNLSCGYYLVFFAPVVVGYCLYEIADRGLWLRWRMWVGLVAAAAAATLATWPFVRPYLWLRAQGFPARPIWEVRQFSADLLSFVTASPNNRIWGWLQTFPHGEADLFPGIVTLVLAGIGLIAAARALASASAPLREPRRRRIAIALVFAACAAYVGVALLVGATSDPSWRFGFIRFRLGDPWKAWAPAAFLAVIAVSLSPRIRSMARGVKGSALGFFVALALAGAVLALGPVVSIAGTPTDLPAPYAQLYWHVPGFDGLRAPSRFAMLSVLGLSVLAGYGAHALTMKGRPGRHAVAFLTAILLLESTGAPVGLDRVSADRGWGVPRAVHPGDDSTPDVYRFVKTLPQGASLLEFPFGVSVWDVQSVFYQQTHHLPIVNGYSGGFPAWYWPMTQALSKFDAEPERAWSMLVRSGASHAIVHRRAYLRPGVADRLELFLSAHGARVIRASGDDRVYALPAS
jgi:hypothetical protein